MDTLSAARAQMGLSLGFHMIFAACGIAMPLLMVMAEGLALRTGKAHYLALARQWGKATGALFVVGAVSGTALSFELGLLWPEFMEFSGAIIGPAFALEGFAFFIEAIFIGLYLYGWDRLSPRAHWLTGLPVAFSGMASGVIVVAVNAWMQGPLGFELDAAGRAINIDPLATFRSPAWMHMAIHSTLSCYEAVAFAVAGIYAWGMLHGRRDAYHRSALHLAMVLGVVSAVLQLVSGDLNARDLAKHQPEKLAAMEAHFETSGEVPLYIGGIPDPETGEVRYALRIPYGLSLLVAHDPQAVIVGLNDFPADERPNVLWVHLSFQVMVGCGMILLGLAAWYWWNWWRPSSADPRWLWWGLVLGTPLGFLALETGWLVTELGRQPWTIYKVMRTSDAVTPVANVQVSLACFTVLYLGLAVAVTALLVKLGRTGRSVADAARQESDHGT